MNFSSYDLFRTKRNEPIIQSICDVDFYKFLMMQFMLDRRNDYGKVPVQFSWINRDPSIRPADIIPVQALKDELDHVRTIRPSDIELSILHGMPMCDDRTKRIFSGWFIRWLKDDFSLPDYNLSADAKTGQFKLTFYGPWAQVTMWETIAMAIISELNIYYQQEKLKKEGGWTKRHFSAAFYKRHIRLLESIMTLQNEPGVVISEFGTRRRASFLWHRYVVQTLKELLGAQFLGTSNVHFAIDMKSANPIGTNAHELPMVCSALAGNDPKKIRASQYDLIDRWYKMYPELSIMLGDTYCTKQFLKNAPTWMAEKCIGARLDSMDPMQAIPLYIDWWKSHGVDPHTKLVIPSDGLTAEEAVKIYRAYHEKVGRISFGIGTHLTNNSKDILGHPAFRPLSQVCKVTMANGAPAVKLSDNPQKATGEQSQVDFFREIFDA